MSDILDQLAGIKILLQEQAEDCAQRAKYEQERREASDKRRAETEAIEAQVRAKLQKIVERREEKEIQAERIPRVESAEIDLLLELIKDNHNSRMEMIQTFIEDCSTLQHQQRTKLLEEISRLRKKS
ncbi:hypothetical protein MVEN_00378200 [Mycena venus]|uniref:Uncharacterized protein n=1 Tax=Mycena venus TaxID=2733690 RepID=A0A8H6YPX5_9AGAR|nr:hypothetical protein MVEN_00378200 [Mycena venus]